MLKLNEFDSLIDVIKCYKHVESSVEMILWFTTKILNYNVLNQPEFKNISDFVTRINLRQSADYCPEFTQNKLE